MVKVNVPVRFDVVRTVAVEAETYEDAVKKAKDLVFYAPLRERPEVDRESIRVLQQSGEESVATSLKVKLMEYIQKLAKEGEYLDIRGNNIELLLTGRFPYYVHILYREDSEYWIGVTEVENTEYRCQLSVRSLKVEELFKIVSAIERGTYKVEKFSYGSLESVK